MFVFPIETDQIGFLGARIPSDVVAFGLFHVLLFYVGVLTLRAYFHERIIREAANADAFEHQKHIRMAQNTLRSAVETIDRDDRREVFDPVSQTYAVTPPEDYTPNAQRGEAEQARADALAVIKFHQGVRAFRQQGRWLAVIGEFVFPIVFGLMSLVLLVLTQSFPMLWDLHLQVRE